MNHYDLIRIIERENISLDFSSSGGWRAVIKDKDADCMNLVAYGWSVKEAVDNVMRMKEN
jgi:hypothetical protein